MVGGLWRSRAYIVEDVDFHGMVHAHIRRSTALAAASEGSSGPDLLGGLLFGVKEPTHHVDWLVISEQARGKGVGRALMAGAMRRAVSGSSVANRR
ncbi:GNAT family N-acetyltransferase [Streptomyces sp. NPDC056190]|uniref:GNAT family N-acetyltransferase n=1 Tax=unclassified Streptomyces TaxID=2593676 RepID=UPI0035DEDE66